MVSIYYTFLETYYDTSTTIPQSEVDNYINKEKKTETQVTSIHQHGKTNKKEYDVEHIKKKKSDGIPIHGSQYENG